MVNGGLHSEIRTEEAKGRRQAPRRINVLAIIVADVGQLLYRTYRWTFYSSRERASD